MKLKKNKEQPVEVWKFTWEQFQKIHKEIDHVINKKQYEGHYPSSYDEAHVITLFSDATVQVDIALETNHTETFQI